MTIEEARETLRIDGTDNDVILKPLLDAVPQYLVVTTGKAWDTEPVHPLAKAVAGFILQLWYGLQTKDAERLQATIDSLLVALTAIGRG